jgi:hypothetical protein
LPAQKSALKSALKWSSGGRYQGVSCDQGRAPRGRAQSGGERQIAFRKTIGRNAARWMASEFGRVQDHKNDRKHSRAIHGPGMIGSRNWASDSKSPPLPSASLGTLQRIRWFGFGKEDAERSVRTGRPSPLADPTAAISEGQSSVEFPECDSDLDSKILRF